MPTRAATGSVQRVQALLLAGRVQFAQLTSQAWQEPSKRTVPAGQIQRPPQIVALGSRQTVQLDGRPGAAQLTQPGAHGSQKPVSGLSTKPWSHTQTPPTTEALGSLQLVQAAGSPGRKQVVQLEAHCSHCPVALKALPAGHTQSPSMGTVPFAQTVQIVPFVPMHSRQLGSQATVQRPLSSWAKPGGHMHIPLTGVLPSVQVRQAVLLLGMRQVAHSGAQESQSPVVRLAAAPAEKHTQVPLTRRMPLQQDVHACGSPGR
ncbi:MAG: hypothetical protein P4L10_12360 [Acidobacteriaceae bacterium]|nr:hypothetical protein [Acidobacteriaceae bacterium]